MRPVNPLLDQEALRVISAMPKWTPGKQDGKAVAVKYTMPITFRQDGGAADGTQPGGEKGSLLKIDGDKFKGSGKVAMTVNGSSPYYIVDGKHVEDISSIKPDQIDHINVYKDAKHTTDKYGDAAKNGVIEVTLKKKKNKSLN